MNPDRRQTPPALTEEQLRFLADLQEESTRRTLRRWIKGAIVGYVVLIAGVFLMYENGQSVSANERSAVVNSGRVVSVEGCNRDYRSAEAFVNLLERLRDSTISQHKQHKIDDARYRAGLEFYSAEIARAKGRLPDCREAETTLTADPDADLRNLKPLYPPGRG